MRVLYASGVRIGALTIDPTERVDSALWTHRPARRPACGRCLASAPLARGWSATLGIPLGAGAVAMGFRIELLPSGYGPGGAAVLLTRDGERTLVVGPTTVALAPRRADRLVLFAAATPTDVAWRPEPGLVGRLLAPDGAAAAVISERLEAAGVAHRRPRWLGRGGGPSGARVRVVTSGAGRRIDARPQASDQWLVRFVAAVAPRAVGVHGPRADRLARALAAEGWPVRVLHGPQQLSLLGDEPAPFVPPRRPTRRLDRSDGPEPR